MIKRFRPKMVPLTVPSLSGLQRGVFSTISPIMCANTGECQFKLISELLLSTWISFISNFHQYLWDSERGLSRRDNLGREGWENSLLFQQNRNRGSKLIWANFPLKQSQNLLKLSKCPFQNILNKWVPLNCNLLLLFKCKWMYIQIKGQS